MNGERLNGLACEGTLSELPSLRPTNDECNEPCELLSGVKRFNDEELKNKEGKVEMEMIVVPAVQADEHPVGKGRNSPEPLVPPNRPDTSFSWFRNPWKACCFVVCRYYRWRILCCCLTFFLIMLLGCAIYAFPGYLVKRLLGA